MVAGYTAAQVRAAEKPHLERGEPLMRMAAAALAAVVREQLTRRAAPTPSVLVFAGTGDNGGDALFAAAELAGEGVRVEVVPTGQRLHPEARAAAEQSGVRIADEVEPAQIARLAAGASVIIDGILGTGTSADPVLRGRARELVVGVLPVLSAADRPMVIAVDLPSGIHPDDGSVPDPAVLAADVTVTFGAAKAGLLLEPGADYAGELRVIDLGLGDELERFTPLVERG
ncbi:NAD(P)H-hydrate epimerase [Agromyces sp. SYSU K20354]|uniref:NAD(P)H-hydrate epimerase n=1 Tax=Agromyces cavernae TaxID=2898659 RepID=UPI001E3F404C|nr:NAD(P)H-hydrate epimerase [Agromyces cavernae]MCD2441898.1 NAD(P)H-hydrate epimerase [Agromyces cavernae]